MKIIRLLAVLSLCSFCSVRVVSAAETKEEKPAEKACDCEKDKDGKACGVDKDCCCTGKKATKSDEKKG